MVKNSTIPYNTIIKGDCIEVLKTLPDNSVNLIFADPPYNMQTDGELLRTDGSVFNGVDDRWDKFDSIEAYDDFCNQWLRECKRLLKNDGSIWVIGSFQNIYRLGYIMQNLGFWILNDIVWSKPNAVPNFAGTRFQNSHETLLWCSKSKKSKFQFNYKTMKNINGNKQMGSVWNIGICIGNERLKDENGQKIHSTQKPEKLLYNIIIASTQPNDLVLDPFFGTGTTGAIAKKTGRNYIGIEREDFYIKHATTRIQNVIPELDMFSNMELEVKPPRISTKDLISRNFLKVGQALFSKDRKFSAILCENGKVSDNEEILSIHKMSAKFLGRPNNNGWDYFWTEHNGNFVIIDSLRYLANEKNNI